ncbi:MAG TPA: squalene/phytoene synthase family protein, partial [Herpetosiphonaceae bacterium]
RAHQLYELSWPGIALLSPDSRGAVATAACVYRGILDKIVANRYDVFARRAHLTLAEKCWRLPAILWRTRRLNRTSATQWSNQ